MLTVESVSWSVNATRILDEVTCRAPAGSFVGLVGPNGSGKTSLLRLIAGIVRPDRGRVLLAGAAVAGMSRRGAARRMAMLAQHAETDLDLLVRDVVLLGRTPHRRSRWADDRDDREAVTAALDRVDLAGFGRRRWHTLSGGERQRVQLARAFAQQPELLLLDEPTNHLDIGHQLRLLHYVHRSGITTVAALHDLNLAAMFCDSLVVLAAGRVAVTGPAAEVLTAALLRDVFDVDAAVTPHPATGRPTITFRSPTT